MKVFRWIEKQLYANQLSLPFYSRFTLRIYTATNGLGGGAKTPWYATAGAVSKHSDTAAVSPNRRFLYSCRNKYQKVL